MSGLVGFTSENFYDIAAGLIYGGDQSTTDSHTPVGQKPHDVETSAPIVAMTSLVSSGASYCALLAVAIVILMRYSPRTVLWFSAAGVATSCLALVSAFIFADQIQSRGADTFAAMRGLVRIDVGYGSYLLIAAFALLLVLQRVVGLDRLLSSAE